MQPLPPSGNYFISLRQHTMSGGPAAVNAVSDALNKCAARPWTANENPTLNSWLQANEKPMALVAEAATRTHYYNPLIPERDGKGSKGLISTLLPSVQACRDLAAAFACRAMLNIGHGQAAAAWQDLLTCHRLGRLVGRGATLIEGLVGMAIEVIACRAEVVFLDRARPDLKTVEQCLRDLAVLPPLPDAIEKLNIGERFMFLDHIMQVDRRGVGYFESMGDGRAPMPFSADAFDGTDWDPALERANKWFDRLTAIARLPQRGTRVQKFTEFTNELNALKSTALTPGRVDQLVKAGKPRAKAKGEAFGDVLLVLLMPAANKVLDAADRARQAYQNTLLAFACAWYQRTNGQYPAKLADLAPDFLNPIPKDLFSGGDLIYRPNATGFLLYSVGPNGIDEGGRGLDSQPAGDDVAVQLPVPIRP
jgi:hypothetical protein